MVTGNLEEAVCSHLPPTLRYCNVSDSIQPHNLQIEQLFVDKLKAVAKRFLCEGATLLSLSNEEMFITSVLIVSL